MIVLSNTAQQTLAPGQSIVFDLSVMHTGCGEFHRKNSNQVRLRANGLYELHFSGAIAGTSGDTLKLTINLDGEPLNETAMLSTATAVTAFNTVANATLIRNCGMGANTVSVTNSGTTTVTLAPNSSFFIKRDS